MSESPAMRTEAMDAPRAGLEAHDHAVCVYDRPEELERALGRFLDEGLRAGASNVFVHSFADDDEAWATVRRAYPQAPELRTDQLVLVRLYTSAFEGDAGRIDHAHVERVVGGLLARATREGRGGVRLFVDASRTYLQGGREDEWFAFESWLGRRLQAEVGLVCAYRRSEAMRPDLLPRVLRTHAYRFG